MATLQDYFTQEWRYIDHTSGLQPMQSFSFDDTFCDQVGNDKSPSVVRTWIHNHVVILGIHDSRLPFLKDGIEFLNDVKGYSAIVRNSGGLGVVLDKGVLNISLIFKGKHDVSIDTGYEVMLRLIREMFKEETNTIENKEITASYCPGSYDLSINNRKFAGISQRRVKGGIAVQIYLCVEGSGAERAEMMKEFYQHALKNEKTKFIYPTIIPESMASLNELLDKEYTTNDILFKLLGSLKTLGATLNMNPVTTEEWALYDKYFERMIERNDKMIRNMKKQ
ncbi:biotin/lipoate A/B protein ligase family protein [Mammaliicoccus vitulinus]|uniref:Octanoyl-[GcvH]:protein N-octanoyltransferase n=1 Tax=Mammaliicoccus vitulinus TaxID=71237 RepID=A0ABX7HGP5_9STAP|nr:biotin/lipoate A/B protein ligase family protein [Mammaliicoccus vitulinus]PNZ39687.1 lipoate--protein ligase [Mammaliicoccus vitulinus]QRO85790.1 lipoate--protein ligase family protein [Mammaliicoccus vitulinus]QTN10729.1 lipoate--protein ligase family protein [Mammaliicoccus vitulinus]